MFFFFQAEDGIRDRDVTGVQTCALPISRPDEGAPASWRSLPQTRKVAAMRRQIGDRAVVLGASMAGLLAARVLADSYAQVTVIDRDELPETPMHRRGVPQGRHVHALLARGRQALEELFPGLTAE